MNLSLFKRVVTFVLTCALVSPMLPAQASAPDETTTITLDKAVHFLGTDGSDVVANPGEYTVEATQEWLRLIPGTERRDALLIEAKHDTHEVQVEIPIAMAIPGETPEELNLLHIQYLNPDGTSLEALGTYDGIRPRGWLSNARAKAKAAAERARRAAAQRAAAARAAALQAKQAAEQAARAAAATAQELALKAKQEAERLAALAAINTCKAAVKADEMAGAIKKKMLEAAEAKLVELKKKFTAPDLIAQAFAVLERQGNRAMEHMANSIPTLNTPVNIDKLKKLMNPYYLCEGGLVTAPREIATMLSATPVAGLLVSSRGGTGWTISVGYQYNQAVMVGLEGGFGVGFPVGSSAKTKGYVFAGGMITAGAGSSHAIQIAFWPGSEPAELGWNLSTATGAPAYWALGFSVDPKELPCLAGKFSTDKVGFFKALATGCNPGSGGSASFAVGIDFVFNWQGQFTGFIVSPSIGSDNKFSDKLLGGILGTVAWQPGLTTTFP